MVMFDTVTVLCRALANFLCSQKTGTPSHYNYNTNYAATIQCIGDGLNAVSPSVALPAYFTVECIMCGTNYSI